MAFLPGAASARARWLRAALPALGARLAARGRVEEEAQWHPAGELVVLPDGEAYGGPLDRAALFAWADSLFPH